jgi:hypothetical protein
MAGGGYTGHDVHIDVPLSQIAIAYKPEGFIADQIAPIVPVNKQSDGYFVWDIADAFRVEDTLRAPGAEANVIEFSVASGTYFAKNYALKDRIPYEDLKNADAAQIFFERSARAERIKDKLMLDMEYRVAKACTSGSNVYSYSPVGSSWAVFANAKPIEDIWQAIQTIQDGSGQRPNSIIFGGYAWNKFRQCDDVKNALFGTAGTGSNGRTVSTENIKNLFEVERLLVGGAYRNSADEGQSVSLSGMWNDNVLVYYAPLTPRKDKPSFMYGFRWSAVPGMDMQAEVYQKESAKAEEVQVGYYQEEKITASALAFLITGVGSSQSGI